MHIYIRREKKAAPREKGVNANITYTYVSTRVHKHTDACLVDERAILDV